MEPSSFDHLTRLVTLVRSRRSLGGVAAGFVAGLLGLTQATAAPCPKGKKPCKGKCIPKKGCCTTATCRPAVTRRICRKRRCVCHPSTKLCKGRCVDPETPCCGPDTKPCEGRCIHPDAACPPAPNAECTVVGTTQSGFPGDLRSVQTFTEPNGGKLTMVELYFARQQADTTGNFLVQINTVDQATGIPQHNTIASVVKPAAEVSRNLDLVYFTFSDPPTLVPGRKYAILLSWPGEGRSYLMELVRPGALCPGGEFFTSFQASGPFQPPLEPEDMYYRTFVSR